MSEPKITIDLHDRTLMELRPWFDHDGYLLSINGKQTAAGNDEDSMQYVLERFIKTIRHSAEFLLKPPEEWD